MNMFLKSFVLLTALGLVWYPNVFGVSKGNSTIEDTNSEVKDFLDDYTHDYADLFKNMRLACWDAAVTGKKKDFDRCAEGELAVKKLHSNKERYEKIQKYLEHKEKLIPIYARALQVAYLDHKENQLSEEDLSKMVKLSNDINHIFNTFRANLEGKKYTNNDLLKMLAKENNSKKRQSIWQALKQVGVHVGPKLVELAKLRNAAAQKLGYKNYWYMKVELQEYQPNELLGIFSELDKTTRKPFKKMKSVMDRELSRRFKTQKLMPWHYDNPFFQSPPPSEKVDLDIFYKDKKKEDIVEIARKFYTELGFEVDGIIERSDLYEREGKDQHAFCEDVDREGDVRTLCNVTPTFNWMDTMMHELGHAVDALYIDRSLPFNLRDQNQYFTTEGVAMLFGTLAQNPSWLVTYAGADPKKVEKLKKAILEQRRREQLIFARWTLVMLNFEKDLYTNPDRKDLNKLWWDYVTRFQMLRRPSKRNQPDWASKPHFTIAPVYYHNYQLGELFAAQLRHVLAKLSNHTGPISELSFNGKKEFGLFFREKVSKPGRSIYWTKFVKDVTGEPLTAKYFAEELK